MMRFIRYALATLCCAASVGFLGLWIWTAICNTRQTSVAFQAAGWTSNFVVDNGTATFYVGKGLVNGRWEFDSRDLGSNRSPLSLANHRRGYFVAFANGVHFPLWYAALIFALAGVASLRLGRRFTIRSAMIATTVVAGLLGMAVIL
ncbi:MAG: hypothetical protein C0485_19550 [Pirellula sp.]|nr:hypothetical protein [Pirellula sp.]